MNRDNWSGEYNQKTDEQKINGWVYNRTFQCKTGSREDTFS